MTTPIAAGDLGEGEDVALEISSINSHGPSGEVRFRSNVPLNTDMIVRYRGDNYIVRSIWGGNDPEDTVYTAYPTAAIEQQRNLELLRDRVGDTLDTLTQAAQGFDDNTLSPAQQRAAIALAIRTVVRLARIQLRRDLDAP